MLEYGIPADATDEYIQIRESSNSVEVFAEQYLRSHTANDVVRLLYINKQQGFPGMLGSLDCVHWRWKNCLTARAEQYAGRSGSPTIILEMVADYDIWISHAYFGMSGTNNGTNVLESSSLFSNLALGIAHPAHYSIGTKEYDTGYYLADSIYSKLSTIVQTIHDPHGAKKQYFAMKQESCRKDVEHAFDVLQS